MRYNKIIFFDGACITCNSFIKYINKRDRNKSIFFSDLRGEKAILVLKENNLIINSIDTIIFINENKVYQKSDAIIEIIMALGNFYRLIVLTKIIPLKLRDYLYDLYAKKRLLKVNNFSCEINNELLNQIV